MSRADAPTILSVNASVVGGGAERIALSLHEEYLRRGLDSWLAVGCRNAPARNTFEIPNDAGRSAWARLLLPLARRIESASRGSRDAAWYASRALRSAAEPARYRRVMRGFEDFEFPETRHLLEDAPERPDVLHLHNLHGSYFDIRALPSLSAAVPTVLTLHDTWLLTGHCANPLACERWRTGCDECPRLDVYVPLRGDESAANRRVKREAVLASRASLALPSAWLLRMAEESGIVAGRVRARVVPNGVDTRVFRPGDRVAARAVLGLPQERPIVTFAARSVTDNPFKDFATLQDALRILAARPATSDVYFVALGGSPGDAGIAGIEGRLVPFVEDPETVARYFQATDVYVHATCAESFGLVVAEAMACATAVVASRVGGLPEVVAEGETGLLVGQGDAAALADATAALLADPARRAAFGAAGAERVAAAFSLSKEADAYLAWYDELLEERRGEVRS